MRNRGTAAEVGAAIAALRKAKSLTQAQVAEGVGVEKETISRMENGVISPSLTRLRQIADVLDCSLCDLFRSRSPDVTDQAHSIIELIQDLAEEERTMVVKFVAEVAKLLKARKGGCD
jgi:transcriptional regulator with XRE-family HTH domain